MCAIEDRSIEATVSQVHKVILIGNLGKDREVRFDVAGQSLDHEPSCTPAGRRSGHLDHVPRRSDSLEGAKTPGALRGLERRGDELAQVEPLDLVFQHLDECLPWDDQPRRLVGAVHEDDVVAERAGDEQRALAERKQFSDERPLVEDDGELLGADAWLVVEPDEPGQVVGNPDALGVEPREQLLTHEERPHRRLNRNPVVVGLAGEPRGERGAASFVLQLAQRSVEDAVGAARVDGLTLFVLEVKPVDPGEAGDGVSDEPVVVERRLAEAPQPQRTNAL